MLSISGKYFDLIWNFVLPGVNDVVDITKETTANIQLHKIDCPPTLPSISEGETSTQCTQMRSVFPKYWIRSVCDSQTVDVH